MHLKLFLFDELKHLNLYEAVSWWPGLPSCSVFLFIAATTYIIFYAVQIYYTPTSPVLHILALSVSSKEETELFCLFSLPTPTSMLRFPLLISFSLSLKIKKCYCVFSQVNVTKSLLIE